MESFLDAVSTTAPSRVPVVVPSRIARAAGRPTSPVAVDSEISAPQQRILDALAAFVAIGLDEVSKSNVAVFCNQSPTSSGFTNNLGRLRSLGLISYPRSGVVALTDEGHNAAHPQDVPASLSELHAAWESKLSRPEWSIVAALIEQYPNAVAKTELAERVRQSPTSSGYTNNLGALRSLGLVDYPQRGFVAATALLFPEGMR
jgi:Mn-dependent DtxR family transcriptional regulator